jgi:hypothetical protein
MVVVFFAEPTAARAVVLHARARCNTTTPAAHTHTFGFCLTNNTAPTPNAPAFHRYVKWAQEAQHAAGGREAVLRVLEAATRALAAAERYYGDPRFLRLWLQYVSAVGFGFGYRLGVVEAHMQG